MLGVRGPSAGAPVKAPAVVNGVAVVVAHCAAFGPRRKGPCVERFHVEVDGDGLALAYYRRFENGVEVQDPPPMRAPVEDAVRTLARCRAHQAYFQGKPIRATLGGDPCGPACREATGAECKCSCGGYNHGVDAA